MNSTRSPKKGFLLLGMTLLLMVFSNKTCLAQNVEKDSTHWVGEWRDDGNLQYAFNLHLKPLGGGQMTGYFDWKLIWTWIPEHKSKIGSMAREYLVGVYDPAQRSLRLRGVRHTDPDDIISMDTYIIQVSADGKSLDGINVKPENYHGSMFGVYLPPKTPAKPKPVAANPTAKPAAKPAEKPAVAVTPKPVQPAAADPSPAAKAVAAPDKELASREIVTKTELKSADTQVRIRVYDESIIDGDVISLNWNGEWITRYYRVAKLPKEIVLDLLPGENTLVMHAENLGRYPPNTATVSIQRGNKTEIFVLNSDMGKSEAIKIFRE